MERKSQNLKVILTSIEMNSKYYCIIHFTKYKLPILKQDLQLLSFFVCIKQFDQEMPFVIQSSADPTLVLDIAGYYTKFGAKKKQLIIWKFHGGKNQLFNFQNKGQFNYILDCKHGGALGVFKGYTNLRATLCSQELKQSQNQKWILQKYNDDQSYIKNYETNLVLQVLHNHLAEGNKVVMYKKQQENKSQRWKLKEVKKQVKINF